jgi:hypothetical protein
MKVVSNSYAITTDNRFGIGRPGGPLEAADAGPLHASGLGLFWFPRAKGMKAGGRPEPRREREAKPSLCFGRGLRLSKLPVQVCMPADKCSAVMPRTGVWIFGIEALIRSKTSSTCTGNLEEMGPPRAKEATGTKSLTDNQH